MSLNTFGKQRRLALIVIYRNWLSLGSKKFKWNALLF